MDWLLKHRDETLLSSIVAAELNMGINVTRGQDLRKMLKGWFDRLVEAHEDRIVPFDMASASKWAEFGSQVLIGEQRVGSRQFDTLIAAQALALEIPLATRNSRDFEGIGLVLINPWGE
ncbi:PIN domain-containing protein [Alterisphingorhabdus coralli]|uniref:PIN domain-containing protein n=1 Tax=Alterisphingorhabdus coralli TaxID=3071408 RepID=A0AA97F4D6_9SPHN|nr:PIN domain-containing protein [Parasphingorhabdus sp. SCSIO 66989]WOE74094.1 hypothetical protein RB602_09515 [Parasphingorhabdus sp. SCSIO 66989]